MQVRFVVRAQNHRITQISQCKGRKNMILHHSQQAFLFFGVLRYYKAEGMGHARWKGGECKTCEVAGSCSGSLGDNWCGAERHGLLPEVWAPCFQALGGVRSFSQRLQDVKIIDAFSGVC